MSEQIGPLQLAATAAFYAISGLTIAGALIAVSARNLFRAALGLGLSFFGLAGLYFMLSAEFMGVAQILVYVGAIMTLIVFAVMLTARLADPNKVRWNKQWVVALFLTIGMGGVLVREILAHSWGPAAPAGTPVTVQSIGKVLLTDYLLPFELLSLLLLGALVGAIFIARSEDA